MGEHVATSIAELLDALPCAVPDAAVLTVFAQALSDGDSQADVGALAAA